MFCCVVLNCAWFWASCCSPRLYWSCAAFLAAPACVLAAKPEPAAPIPAATTPPIATATNDTLSPRRILQKYQLQGASLLSPNRSRCKSGWLSKPFLHGHTLLV